MDKKDLPIIDLLPNNGKLSYAEIGDKIEFSVSAVSDKILEVLKALRELIV